MFTTCNKDIPSYDVNTNLQGIVVDWSDTERAGLIKALGSELATKLLRGCAVHWARSYQRVAAGVSTTVPNSNRILARQAFEYIPQAIPNLKSGECAKCFNALKGEIPAAIIASLVPNLTTDHISIVDIACKWSNAKA